MFTSIPKGVKSFTPDIPVDYTIQNRYPLSSLGELFIPTINFQNLPISPSNLSSKIYTVVHLVSSVSSLTPSYYMALRFCDRHGPVHTIIWDSYHVCTVALS